MVVEKRGPVLGLIGGALQEAVKSHPDSIGFVYQGKEVLFMEMYATSDRVVILYRACS